MAAHAAAPSQLKTTGEKGTNAEPPFFSECEIFEEGEPDALYRFAHCTKNPGHKEYIPVNRLTMNDLPKECRSEKSMKAIKNCCDRTVKLSIKYTSKNRPDYYPNPNRNIRAPYPDSRLRGSRRAVRVGTGVIYHVQPTKITNKPCPCHVCKISGTPVMEFGKVEVFTAAHVVFDDSEAECTVCELFYDSEDRDNVKCLYGVKGAKNRRGGNYPGSEDDNDTTEVEERCSSDRFFIKCVTHDLELFEVLKSKMGGIYSQYRGLSPLKFIVSHPHGFTKHIAFGKSLHYTIPIPHTLSHPCHSLTIPVGMRITCDGDESEMLKLSQFTKYFARDTAFLPGFNFVVIKQLYISFPKTNSQTYLFAARDDSIEWVEFPKGSTFFFSKRVHLISYILPFTNLRFYLPEWVNIFDHKSFPFFMTYDMATCAGSSGAQVVAHNEMIQGMDWSTHFGSLSSGRNRSGTSKHFVHGAPNSTCEYMMLFSHSVQTFLEELLD